MSALRSAPGMVHTHLELEQVTDCVCRALGNKPAKVYRAIEKSHTIIVTQLVLKWLPKPTYEKESINLLYELKI